MEKIGQQMGKQGGVSAYVARRVLLSVGFVFVLGLLSISLTGHHGGIEGRGGGDEARATEASVVFATTDGVVLAAARHGRATDDIELAGRSLLGSASSPSLPSLKINNPNLISSQRVALKHEPETPFNVANQTHTCGSIIRNLVLDSPHNILYYILEERCGELGKTSATHWRQSLRLADLGNVSAGGGIGNGNLPEEKVISYWWRGDELSGPAPSNATFVLNPGTTDSNVMTSCNGMDLPSSGSHLVVGTSVRGGSKANVAVLSTSDGSRSSILTEASGSSSLAFNQNRSRLYTVEDTSLALTLRSAILVEGGDAPPSAASGFEMDTTILKNSNPKIGAMTFGHDSFDPEGNCLYFVDMVVDRVWGIDLSSTSKTPTAIAGSGIGTEQDGDALMASFFSPTAVAVTPDGCNMFVSQQNGLVRWVKLDKSPCAMAQSVHTVAEYRTSLLEGLTLRATDTLVHLYVGSSDGHVFELEIKKELLHNCNRTPPPEPPPPTSSPPSIPGPVFTSENSYVPSTLPPVTPSSSQPSPGPPRRESATRDPVVFIVLPILSAVIGALVVCATFCYFRSPRPGPVATAGESKSIEVPINQGGSGIELPTTSGSGNDRRSNSAAITDTSQHEIKLVGVTAFTHAQLSACTGGFNANNLIGQAGAFGTVYRGWIRDKEVAVKIMHGALSDVKMRQFAAEVNTLSTVHHSNLVQLIGYCDQGDKLMLVYPYFKGGSLHSRLHDKVVRAEQPPLTLLQRVSIALDIAEGLRYLHHCTLQPIIHRDVKSSNVLLSAGSGRNITAVIADFGLATIVEKMFEQPEDAIVSTLHLAGTAGYMAPEYYSSLRLSVKTDVYAFGVIVLELLTGRKALIQAGTNQTPLVHWVKSMTEDQKVSITSIVEECLQAEIISSVQIGEMIQHTVNLAMWCTGQDDNRRPTMTEALDRIRAIHSRVRHLTPDQ